MGVQIMSARRLCWSRTRGLKHRAACKRNMGRWAFFNTGLEYKFVFALQQSLDILQFNGWFNNSWDENPIVKWSAAEEEERILEKLRHMEAVLGLPERDFTKYSADLEGTEDLKSDLYEDWISDNKARVRYVLGCLIYHQLLYKPVLEARFEF